MTTAPHAPATGTNKRRARPLFHKLKISFPPALMSAHPAGDAGRSLRGAIPRENRKAVMANERKKKAHRAPVYEVEAAFSPDPARMLKALLVALGCSEEEVYRALQIWRAREREAAGVAT